MIHTERCKTCTFNATVKLCQLQSLLLEKEENELVMSSTTDQNPVVTVNLFSFAITLLRNVRDKLMRDENNTLRECKFVA